MELLVGVLVEITRFTKDSVMVSDFKADGSSTESSPAEVVPSLREATTSFTLNTHSSVKLLLTRLWSFIFQKKYF